MWSGRDFRSETGGPSGGGVQYHVGAPANNGQYYGSQYDSADFTDIIPASQYLEPQKGRGALIAIIVLLMLALVGSLSAATYFWRTANAWQTDSAAWELKAAEQATNVAELNGELALRTAQLSALEGELGSASDRITSLAGEKAALGDESELQKQYLAAQQLHLEYQSRISDAATTVADSLARCTDGQKQLIGYLREAELYDPTDLTNFGNQVDALCADAVAASAELRNQLNTTVTSQLPVTP